MSLPGRPGRLPPRKVPFAPHAPLRSRHCRRGVKPRHIRAKPRHRLGENAAAAADIDKAEPRERRDGARVSPEPGNGALPDPADADGVEAMQHRHGPGLVPPGRGHRVKARDFSRIARVAQVFGCLLRARAPPPCHDLIPSCRAPAARRGVDLTRLSFIGAGWKARASHGLARGFAAGNGASCIWTCQWPVW